MSKHELISALWSFVWQLFLFWMIGMALVYIIARIARHVEVGRDDTDPPQGRSDLKIYTDHKTGCQYLGSARGGLTPRLDRDGRHICNPDKAQP